MDSAIFSTSAKSPKPALIATFPPVAIARDDAGVEASCEVKASAFDRSDASGRLAYLRPDGLIFS